MPSFRRMHIGALATPAGGVRTPLARAPAHSEHSPRVQDAGMHVVFWVCGALALVSLAASLPGGGWKIVVPLLVWCAVMLPISEALASAAERLVALAVTLAGAFAVRTWAVRRFAVDRSH